MDSDGCQAVRSGEGARAMELHDNSAEHTGVRVAFHYRSVLLHSLNSAHLFALSLLQCFRASLLPAE